jgi:hypothetical protein
MRQRDLVTEYFTNSGLWSSVRELLGTHIPHIPYNRLPLASRVRNRVKGLMNGCRESCPDLARIPCML